MSICWTRTKAACDVKQRYVRDGSVEHLHERGKRHREGDDPGLTRGRQPNTIKKSAIPNGIL